MTISGEASVYNSPMILPKQCIPISNSLSLLSHLNYFSLLMAEHPDSSVHVRADIYGHWHSHIPYNPILESAIGRISYSQSHHPSTGNNVSQQQDAVGCSMVNNPSLPMPSRHPMQGPQNIRNYHFSSFDSAHVGFGSDLGSAKFESRCGAANNNYTEAFENQPVRIHVEPLAHESRSRISGLSPLWLLSYCSRIQLIVLRCFRPD